MRTSAGRLTGDGDDPNGNGSAPAETLRDRFAMAALTGILSGNSLGALVVEGKDRGEHPSVTVTMTAYELADAMMKSREAEL